MGSDESHFNVSLIGRDKVKNSVHRSQFLKKKEREADSNKTVFTDHTFYRERKPKRIPTEGLLLTSLTPYRLAKPAYSPVGLLTSREAYWRFGKLSNNFTHT